MCYRYICKLRRGNTAPQSSAVVASIYVCRGRNQINACRAKRDKLRTRRTRKNYDNAPWKCAIWIGFRPRDGEWFVFTPRSQSAVHRRIICSFFFSFFFSFFRSNTNGSSATPFPGVRAIFVPFLCWHETPELSLKSDKCATQSDSIPPGNYRRT